MHIVFVPKLFPTQMLSDYTFLYILLSSLKNLPWRWFQSICIHREARALMDAQGEDPWGEFTILSVSPLHQQCVHGKFGLAGLKRMNEYINEVGEGKMPFKMR